MKGVMQNKTTMLGAVALLVVGMVVTHIMVSDDVEQLSGVSSSNADLAFLLPQNTAVERNPFQYKDERPAVAKVEQQHEQAVAVEKQREVTPVIPQQEKGPLDGIQYVGMLVKGGKNHAFILKDSQRYVVAEGEMVASQFQVAQIKRDHVVFVQQPSGKRLLLNAGGGE